MQWKKQIGKLKGKMLSNKVNRERIWIFYHENGQIL